MNFKRRGRTREGIARSWLLLSHLPLNGPFFSPLISLLVPVMPYLLLRKLCTFANLLPPTTTTTTVSTLTSSNSASLATWWLRSLHLHPEETSELPEAILSHPSILTASITVRRVKPHLRPILAFLSITSTPFSPPGGILTTS